MDRADQTQLRDEAKLRDEARSAYERARLRAAVLGTWPVLVLAGACVALGMRSWFVLVAAIVHASIVVALLHRGRAAGRAVTTGWVAGSLPFVVSLLGCRVPHACAGASSGGQVGCIAWCLPSCLFASFIAGALIVRHARARPAEMREAAFAAAIVAALTGGMGCALLGIGGAVALLGGLAVVTAPAMFVAARR
jgi:hypothetical protein